MKWESQIFSGLPALCDFIDSGNSEQLFDRFSDRVLGHLYSRNVGGRYDAGLFEYISREELSDALQSFWKRLSSATSEQGISQSCRTFSDTIFKVAASQRGKDNWCEKTPRNLLYADLIQKIYPDAKFINLVRDGRDVVSSIVEKDFWPIAKSIRFESTKAFGGEVRFEKAVDYWADLMMVTELVRKRVGSANWLDIRLEDLTVSTDSILNQTEDFLGLDHDPEFFQQARVLVKPGSAKSGRFKNDLSKTQVDYLMDRQMEYLKEYDYI